LPQHSRSLGQTAASCHKVVNDNSGRTWADGLPQTECPGQVLVAGPRIKACLIGY